MSNTTTGNPQTLAERASVPTLRNFQMDTDVVGAVQSSLNLFAGKVGLPIELINLQGRGGLSTQVSLGYSSDVAYAVQTWNLEAPTSILGLGWSLDGESIERDLRGSLSPYDDAFFLRRSDGSATELHLLSRDADAWVFEAESFDFSVITYFPARDSWEITGIDGLTRRFGDSPNARQRGVHWGQAAGNWSDASIQLGQGAYTLAWNLSSISNTFGDMIGYTYTEFSDDEVRIGPAGGLSYTRAKYLSVIADPAGREVRFHYSEKRNDDQVREYVLPHVEVGPERAYQDRYETRFLEAIDVVHPGRSQPTLSVRFCYELQRYTDAVGEPATLFKRYLSGFALINDQRKLLPGMRFTYESRSADEFATGALVSAVFPNGAVVDYTYEQRAIGGTQLKHVATRDQTGAGVPRVWIGPNYTVIARYDALNQRRLVVSVFDWNGSWHPYRAIDSSLEDDLDLDSLTVDLQDDFFVISARFGGHVVPEQVWCRAVRRQFGRYGVWDAVSLEAPPLPRPGTDYQVAAGVGFVVLAVNDVAEVLRYVWDPRSLAWQRSALAQDGGGQYSVVASGSLALIARLDPVTGISQLQLIALESGLAAWRLLRLESFAPSPHADAPMPTFVLSETFAGVIFITRVDEERKQFDYEVRLYRWDRFLQNPVFDRQVYRDLPTNSETPYLLGAAAGSLVGNAQNLFRFNGTTWVAARLGDFSMQESPQFAYGRDLAVVTSGVDTAVMSYRPELDAFERTLELRYALGPRQPTVAGNYLTIGNRIYYRQPNGGLRYLRDLPADAEQIANDGDRFIAYGYPDGRSFVLLLKNGEAAPLAETLVGRAFVPDTGAPGTVLFGPTAFATYVGPSFDAAEEIHLHRSLHGRVSGPIYDYVVVSSRLRTAEDSAQITRLTYPSSGTTGPFGLGAQYAQVELARGTDGEETPFGHESYTYFDGLSPSSADPGLPYALFNGLLREKRAYAADGFLLRSEVNTWDATRNRVDARTGASRDLFGAYVRLRREEARDLDPAQPGVSLVHWRETAFSASNGLPVEIIENNIDSRGQAQRLAVRNEYAFEHYPDLAALNWLDQVALATRLVDGVVVAREARLWGREWPSGLARLAPRAQLQARNAAAELSSAQWLGEVHPDPADWLALDTVTDRDRFGSAVAQRDATGLTSSLQLDAEGRFVVAQWIGADRTRGQAGYLGFEHYESIEGWMLGGSAHNLEAAIHVGDAHCGDSALLIAAASAPGQGLSYSAPISESMSRTYVFAAWVKTPSAAVLDSVSAQLRMQVGAATQTLALEPTHGAWRYVWLLLEVTGSDTEQTLSVAIDNTGSAALWVDDVRFGPAASDFRATAWDTLFRPIDAFTSNGQTVRRRYGDLDNTVIEVDAEEALVALWSPQQSWPAARGVAGLTSNSLLSLKPQTFGTLQSFVLGPDWSVNWNGQVDAFVPHEGRLEHRGTAEAQIHYADLGDTSGDWFVSARIQPLLTAADTRSYGLVAGDLRLECDEARAGWRLVALPERSELARSSFAPLLQLPASAAPVLNEGRVDAEIVAAFTAAAAPLTERVLIDVIDTGQRWRLSAGGDTGWTYELVLRTGAIEVARRDRRLLLVVLGQTVVAFADGRRLFAVDRAQAPDPQAGIFAAAEVSFDQLCVGTHPQVSLDYQDGALLTRQSQVVADTSVIATQRFYDTLGRAAVTSQGAELPLAGGALLDYTARLAIYDWSAATLSGLVAEQNIDSGAFAYARTRYEASPLGRPVQRGLPGADFAIPPQGGAGHTARTRYGLSDGRFGEPVGAFRLDESINADGQQVVTLSTLRQDVVIEAALAGTAPDRYDLSRRHYDPAGRLIELQSPMGWSDRFEYDFMGRRTRSRHANDSADRRMVYDRAGRLRFALMPDGAASALPYYQWFKYDLYSRPTSAGVAQGAWDPSQLAVYAEDPDWPDLPAHRATEYDGLWRGDLLAVGLPARSQRSLQDESPQSRDPVLVMEERFYDIWVQTIAQHYLISGSNADSEWQVGYEYDNLSKVLATHYPALGAATALSVLQRYDRVGRAADLTFDGQRHAYRYDRNGLLIEERWLRPDLSEAVRRLRYNSAAWPVLIEDPGLRQTLRYTEGGVGGRGFFSGKPAAIEVAERGGIAAWSMRLDYDTKGALSACQIDQGGADAFRYDANGNLLKIGAADLSYSATGHDRTLAVAADGASAAMSYRADGALSQREASTQPQGNLSMGYDVLDGAPLRVERGVAPAAVLQRVHFDASGQRILREVNGAVTTYVRSLSGDPLLELAADGSWRWHVYGPSGAAFLGNGQEWAYLSRDSIGSIRALVDASSQLLAGYDFLPFGAALRAPFGPLRLESNYRFISREWDPVELYDLRARYYDPSIGRFLSQDPKFQQASPYVYAANLPVLLEDPNGEELLSILIGLLVGAAIGAAVGAATGAISGVVEIVSRDLEGGEAAGVFFGFLGLGVAVGAVGGAITGGVGAALPSSVNASLGTVALNIGITTATGAATGGVLGAAESAGQAALLGEDAGSAAWKGALSAAIGAGIGGFLSETIEPVARLAKHGRAAFQKSADLTANGWTVFAASTIGGAAGGAASGGVAGALNGDSAADVFVSSLQSAALGFLGALPELRKKPWKVSKTTNSVEMTDFAEFSI